MPGEQGPRTAEARALVEGVSLPAARHTSDQATETEIDDENDPPIMYLHVVRKAMRQIRMPALTTMLIVALAYLMDYLGLTYTLGIGAATAGLM